MTYHPDPETIEIEVPTSVAAVAAGHDPLTLTVRTVLTQHELTAVAEKLSTIDEAYDRWAPVIVGWNAAGIEPPAVAGPDALRCLPAGVAGWIVAAVSTRVAGIMSERVAALRAETPKIMRIVADGTEPAADC